MNFVRPVTHMLVISRCFSTVPKSGKYSREIANYKEEIVKLKEQRAKFLELVDHANIGKTKKKLTERHLSFLKDKVDAKYVRLTFNLLSKTNQLDFLNKSRDEIYPGQEMEVDPILKSVRIGYEKESRAFTFGSIVHYLQQLADGDLGKLEKYYYNEQVNKLNDRININNEWLDEKIQEFNECKGLATKKVSDFKEGDFSFIPGEFDRNLLQKAYEIVKDMNALEIFAFAPEKSIDYLTWNHPRYKLMTKEFVNCGIDTGNLVRTVSHNLKLIHDLGWNGFVSLYLEKVRKDLGPDITVIKDPGTTKRPIDYI